VIAVAAEGQDGHRCWTRAMRTSENSILLGCEYPGEWLWATSWTGLTLLLGEPKRCLASDTSAGSRASPHSHPGLEARDLIGACR